MQIKVDTTTTTKYIIDRQSIAELVAEYVTKNSNVVAKPENVAFAFIEDFDGYDILDYAAYTVQETN